MNDFKTIVLAQAFISCMMAFLMTGFFALLEAGFHARIVQIWGSHFVIAWPVAFLFSLVVGKIGFEMARKVMRVSPPELPRASSN